MHSENCSASLHSLLIQAMTSDAHICGPPLCSAGFMVNTPEKLSCENKVDESREQCGGLDGCGPWGVFHWAHLAHLKVLLSLREAVRQWNKEGDGWADGCRGRGEERMRVQIWGEKELLFQHSWISGLATAHCSDCFHSEQPLAPNQHNLFFILSL